MIYLQPYQGLMDSATNRLVVHMCQSSTHDTLKPMLEIAIGGN